MAALRSVLRKAAPALRRGSPAAHAPSPAVGLTSPPVVHGISPAAGSRPLSQFPAGGGTTIYSKEEINRMRAEGDKNLERIRQNLVVVSENQRRRDEHWASFEMKIKRIETACDVANLLSLSFLMALIVNNMQ